MSMDGKVWAISKATGQRVRVPVSWLASPVLGARYEEIVPVEEVPTERSSHAQLDAFAAAHDIDLGEAKTRAEKVAAIDAAIVEDDGSVEDDSEENHTTTSTGDDQPPAETPATGGQE